MSSISSSSVSIDPIKFPFFEDITPSSGVRFSSNDLEEVYDLFVDKKPIGESIPKEELIIKKFNKCLSLSTRHFTFDRIARTNPLTGRVFEEMTFYHLACLTRAEKVIDWFIEHFPYQKQFELSTKPTPLSFVLSFLQIGNDGLHVRIMAKMTKAAFDIRKKCVDSSHRDAQEEIPPGKRNRWFLTKPEIDTLLATKPKALLTDRVCCAEEDATNEMLLLLTNTISKGIFASIFESMLETHTKTQVMTEISNYSPIPFAVTSIIHDYVPFFLTQKGRDFLTLTIEPPKSRLKNSELTSTILLTPFKMVLRQMMSKRLYQNRIEQFLKTAKLLLKTAKLLLNYDEDLPELPSSNHYNGQLSIRMEFEHLLPTDFIDRIKKSHENSLGLLARELKDFYKDNPMKAKEAFDMHFFEENAIF